MDEKLYNPELSVNVISPVNVYQGDIIYDYVEDRRIVLAQYEQDIWPLPGHIFNTNRSESTRQLRFQDNGYQTLQKYLTVQWLHNGDGKPSALPAMLIRLNYFLNWLSQHFPNLAINHLKPIHVAQYADYRLKSVKPQTLCRELDEIQRMYRYLLNTEASFTNPFLDTTPQEMARFSKRGSQKPKTEHIPFDVLTRLYQFSKSQLDQANHILESSPTLIEQKANNPIITLRDACIFITLITTGMRQHELCWIETGAIKPMGDEFDRFYALYSKTSKTTGQNDPVKTYWMAPEDAKRAIEALTQIMKPLQRAVSDEIQILKEKKDKNSLLAAKKLDNEVSKSLLIGYSTNKNSFQVLSDVSIRNCLKRLVKKADINFKILPHQCRRTYARLVAKHQFGDLRVLSEQFKHTSMDMTAVYADDDTVDEYILKHLDKELVEIVQEEFQTLQSEAKRTLVEYEPMFSGGAGRRIADTRRESFRDNFTAVKVYNDEELAILLQSTRLFGRGHAYCMNDTGPCDNFDCVHCDAGIITKDHLAYWVTLWHHQKELEKRAVNNPQLQIVIEHNQESARKVFSDFGVDMQIVEAAA